jgi:hypothetical protein
MNLDVVLIVIGVVGCALVVVVVDDWLKRSRQEPKIGAHRLQELNQTQSFFQKLWATFLLLVFAALITPFFLMGLQLLADPVIHYVVQFIFETTGAFYLVLLIYIWWRPRWLTHLYGLVESKLIGTAYLVAGMIAIGAMVVILRRLVLPLLR